MAAHVAAGGRTTLQQLDWWFDIVILGNVSSAVDQQGGICRARTENCCATVCVNVHTKRGHQYMIPYAQIVHAAPCHRPSTVVTASASPIKPYVAYQPLLSTAADDTVDLRKPSF